MTREALAEKLGISGASVTRIENGEQQPRTPLLLAIARMFGVQMSDFYADDPTEPNVGFAKVGAREVPLWDGIAAGPWAGVAPYLRDEEMQETVPGDEDWSSKTFAMRISGNSMTPRFDEGDIVIIDPSARPRPEDFVVATDDKGEATFAQYHECGLNSEGRDYFELVKLNPAYKKMRSDRQAIVIQGVMLEQRKPRRR